MSRTSAAYTAALATAAVFDRSAVGKVTLIGPDAVTFLHRLCTNDIAALPVGGGCEAYLCDPRAKVQHQLWVHRTADGLVVETVPGRGEALFRTLDRFLISERIELADVTARHVQCLVAGPASKSVIESVWGSMPTLAAFHSHQSAGPRVTRRDVLGVEGYAVTGEKALWTDVLARLITAGAELGTEYDYETLRVEAGSPEFGKDIDESRFVLELPNALRGVSYTKGCFPGQEPIVMSRDRAGFVNRAFLGLKVTSGGIIPAGTVLIRDGLEVGVTTSCVMSPRLDAPLALAYVKRGHQERGTALLAGDQSVEVLGFPPLSS
jgi:folate-binding protein YgfZ